MSSQPPPFQPNKPHDPYLAEVVHHRDSRGGGGVAIAIALGLVALVLMLVCGVGAGGLLYFKARGVAMQPPMAPPPMMAAPPLVEPQLAPLRATISEQLAQGPIDALAQADPASEMIRGSMERNGAALQSQHGQPDTLSLGQDPPLNYDLDIELERLDSDEGFFLGLVVNGRQCMLNVDGFPPGYRSGLDLIDGERVTSPTNPTATSGRQLEKGRTYRLLVQVRDNSVKATLDDKPLVDWKGDAATQLGCFPLFKTPHEPTLFIGTWNAPFKFTKIELRPAP